MIEMKINMDYYGYGKMFKKDSITFKPGLNILVGCNGSGKTTILNQIYNEYRSNNHKDIKFMSYNNLSDGAANGMQSTLMAGLSAITASLALSSEGEGINIMVGKKLMEIGNFVKYNTNSNINKIIFTMDGIDSGTSLDIIKEIKDALHFVHNDMKSRFNIDSYFIITSNSYAFTIDEYCIDARTCEQVSFKSYDDYYKFIMNSSKEKDKRNKRWERNRERREAKEKENNYRNIGFKRSIDLQNENTLDTYEYSKNAKNKGMIIEE